MSTLTISLHKGGGYLPAKLVFHVGLILLSAVGMSAKPQSCSCGKVHLQVRLRVLSPGKVPASLVHF
jgi:hypothetical protein